MFEHQPIGLNLPAALPGMFAVDGHDENRCPIRGNVEFKGLTEGYLASVTKRQASAGFHYFVGGAAVCGNSSLAATDQTSFFMSTSGGLASSDTVALCWLQPSTSTEILISPSVK